MAISDEQVAKLIASGKIKDPNLAAQAKSLLAKKQAAPEMASGGTLPEVKIEGDLHAPPEGDIPMRRIATPEETADLVASDDAAAKAEFDRTHNPKQANLSKRFDDEHFRDPEFHPAADASGLMAAVHALPTYLGGKTVHWHEPSQQQFQRDGGKGSYEEYADRKWVEAYEHAKATNTPIVRQSQASNEGWVNKAANVADSANQTAQAGAMGFLDGAFLGIPTALAKRAARAAQERGISSGPYDTNLVEELDKAEEAHPIAKTVGEVGGVVSPVGVAGMAGKAAKGLAGGVLDAAALGGRALPAGIGRALGAAGEGAVAGGVQSLGESASGHIAGDSDESFGDALKKAGKSAALTGGISGATGALLGEGARAARGQIRKNIPELEPMERTGVGETSMLHGVEPTELGNETLKQAYDAQDSTGEPRRATPQAMAGLRLGKNLGGYAAERGARAQFDESALRERFFGSNQTDFRSTGAPLKALTEAHNDLIDSNGMAAPFREGEVNRLRKHIDQLVGPIKPFQTPDEARQYLQSVRGRDPDAMLVSHNVAQRMGINVDSVGGDGGPANSNWFVVTPRRMNPQMFHKSMEGVDDLLKEAQANPTVDRSLAPLAKAMREMRDGYGDPEGVFAGQKATISERNPQTGQLTQKTLTGYSAFEHNVSERIRADTTKNQAAGLPAEPSAKGLSDNQADSFEGQVSQYGNPKRPRQNEALRARAREADAASGGNANYRDLQNIEGFNAYDKVKESAKLRHMLNPFHGIGYMATPAALRLDPALGAIAAPGFAPKAGLAANQGYQKRQPLFDLLQMLSPPPPPPGELPPTGGQ